MAAFSLLFPRRAYAYIDPGTGSYIFQLLVAALVGVAFAVKLYWNKIRGLFKKPSSREEENESAQG